MTAADTTKLGNEQSLKIKYNQQTVAIWPVFNSVIKLTGEAWKVAPFDVIISCFLVDRSMHGNHSVFRSQDVRYVPEKVVYATSVWIQNMYLLPIYFYVFSDILGYENINNISMTIILKFQPVPGAHVQSLCSEADF